MVQFFCPWNGIEHGSSWYLASGRMAFAFSWRYRLIKFQSIFICLPNAGAYFAEDVLVCSTAWRAYPTFRSRRVELLAKNCTMCPQTIMWMCWGCNLELGEVFPVCSPSTGRNCFAEMHKLRTDIWYWIFYDTNTKNEYVHTLNMKKRWKVHDYKLEKCYFHACARRVHVPIIFILTTAFITHWYFVLQKNSYDISFKKKLHCKILKICSFSWFFENDWNTNRWLEKSEHKIIKIHEIRFFIMSYLTVLTSYHTM